MANKRVVDGPGIWNSGKLKQVQPVAFRAEFANLIPLATANGTFECSPDLILHQVYGFNRPDMTLDLITKLLDEYERVKLLFRWNGDDCKVYGYWIGIDKAGRLPPNSRRGHEVLGPDVPKELLDDFLKGKIAANHWLTSGSLGFGSGLGSGSGLGEAEGGATAPDNQHQPQPQVPLSPACTENGQIDGQVDEIQGWMLGLTPPLKFAAASKDGETQSTKSILARRLKEGISVAEIKLAIAKIPLDFAPNPGFEVRDNLDAAINQVLKDHDKAAEQESLKVRLMDQERAKALTELAEADRKQAEEDALAEQGLGL
jgi:hypothetical protein